MKGKIIIIGAGLGGLALAQGLRNTGYEVTVFERDESATSRPQGFRISIRSLGMRALKALLLSSQENRLADAKIADVGDGFTLADKHMEPFFSVPQGNDAAVQFLRSELRELLQDGIQIEWNKQLVRVEDTGEQAIAYFEDGSKVKGDLLVGCDGGGSIVRTLFPSIYNKGLGSVPTVVDSYRAVLGGNIDRTPEWDRLLPLSATGLVRFVGPNTHDFGVCFSERADRTPTVFWALSEEIHDPSALRYQFDHGTECRMRILDHCKHILKTEQWHEHLQKLVWSTSVKEIMPPWLIRTTRFPEEEHFPMAPTGRVTLLGDAAHAMPTEKGLGGNNVLEDARLLSSLLKTFEGSIDWKQVIRQYEREMFARAKVAIQESEAAAAYFHSLLPLE